MSTVLHERAIARQPQQTRAKERFDLVLDAAHELLEKEGLSGFSIPALAEKLGYPRATIYKFFPTPYAVLNELVLRKLTQLEQRLTQQGMTMMKQPWREVLRAIGEEAVRFYNGDEVARMLLLGGAVTDESYRALEFITQRLGEFIRFAFRTLGLELPLKPDVATLVVEIGTTCFRLSQFLHGKITPEYREEAIYAMEGYIARYTAEIDRKGA